MLALTELREAAADDAAAPLYEQFTPLCERAVRPDGTIGIKIIGPGWGSSGYYGRPVLERDVPRVFPPGTQMFWNHDTPTEEMERPEGDLSRLAAVTVSSPIWLDNGPKGPGMYADARPFAGYAEAIDEIGEHIGVSIRALGRQTLGEAEGKQGRIIQELVAGKSVDFVTVPGAGGAILSVFESAPGAPELNPLKKYHFLPNIETFLLEAGRVLSAANEAKLRAALEQLTAVLQLLDQGQTSEAGRVVTAQISEALSNNDLRDRLREQLKARFGGPSTYVWPQDWSESDGWVVFEMSTNTDTAVYKLGMTVTENDVQLAAEAPIKVRAVINYVMSESARPGAANSTEDDMSEQELTEARNALAEAQQQLRDQDAAVARLQEQLLLREARDFVTDRLAETDLPDVTRVRLARELAGNPPVADDRLDEAELGKRLETAVAEARAEIAAIAGSDGRVTGNGDSARAGNGGAQVPSLAESRKRTEAALAGLGYNPVKE